MLWLWWRLEARGLLIIVRAFVAGVRYLSAPGVPSNSSGKCRLPLGLFSGQSDAAGADLSEIIFGSVLLVNRPAGSLCTKKGAEQDAAGTSRRGGQLTDYGNLNIIIAGHAPVPVPGR
jgi:hypothetical protein